jgi:hypothetical protein
MRRLGPQTGWRSERRAAVGGWWCGVVVRGRGAGSWCVVVAWMDCTVRAGRRRRVCAPYTIFTLLYIPYLRFYGAHQVQCRQAQPVKPGMLELDFGHAVVAHCVDHPLVHVRHVSQARQPSLGRSRLQKR